jgi:predicted nucleotidyltransferase
MKLAEFSNESLITLNNTLNPKLWNKGVLKPEIAAKLKEIAKAFIEFVRVGLDVEDITVTGSNANFTWTDFSDIDLHIVVSGLPTDEARELYSAKKTLWSDQHDITVKGLPVECYIQGADEEHHSTGVYSLLQRTWIVKPSKTKPKVNDQAVEAKKDAVLHDIQLALLSKDLEKIRTVKDKIVKMRKAGLERAGEWSTENLVFKIIRNLGLIDELAAKITELEDQELSLENQDNLLD